MDTWVASTFWLLWMLQWTWVYKNMFRSLLSILLCICQEVELLDHVVILFLIFWGITILFSTVAPQFCIPTSGAQGFHFLHILTNTYFCFILFFIIAMLMCVQWYLTMVLMCISLMIRDVEHLFMCLLVICFSSFEKHLFSTYAHF